MPMQRISFMLIFALLPLQGCGLFQRSEQATNAEQEPPAQPVNLPNTAPAPQTIEGATKPNGANPHAPNPIVAEAQTLFQQAQKAQNDAAFGEAAELWRKFLDHDTGMPGFEAARYNFSFCLFSLGQQTEAIDMLKNLLEETHDGKTANDARILLAEGWLAAGKFEDALATTYDVLPNPTREAQAGLYRHGNAVGIDPTQAPATYPQKIRLLTIRGRIFAALQRPDEAKVALDQARQLLLHASKGEVSPQELQFLSANYAWRKLEVTGLSCQQSSPVPERLSEREFLDYADAYYGCLRPTRSFYCTVLATQNEQVRSQALTAYKRLVLAPLAIKDHLPPPARKVKTEAQRGRYESELKALIEKTVEDHAAEFKQIDSCHAHDVF